MTGLRGKPLRGQDDEIAPQASATDRANIWTLLPGEIVDFDATTQTATVKLLHVPQIAGQQKPFPQLRKVPVVFPRGGGYGLTWPIAAGDPVGVRFASRNMDAWYADGGEQVADSRRMHDLSDAVAVAGDMVSSKQAIEGFSTTATELRSMDGKTKVELGADKVRVVKGRKRLVHKVKGGVEYVQLKIKPSDDPDAEEAADLHFTLMVPGGIVTNGTINSGADPLPEE